MLEDIADQLYALPPGDFTAARDQAAKGNTALAAQLKALRKPTASAWLVNMLVRADPGLLDELLDLGPALARAQREGDGDAVRALGEQRRRLVRAAVERALALTDGSVSAAVRAEIASTLEAGLAEPASADAVRSGRLVRALSFAGFGGVDLAGAVAVPRPPRRPRATPADPVLDDRAARVAEAERVALDAAGALDDAVRAREAAASAHAAAEAVQAQTAAAVERLRAQAAEAERSLAGAQRAAAATQQRLEASGQGLVRAQQAAEQARTALDGLRRGS